MLVCNVSVRARRIIAVEIVEVAGAAEDVPGVAGFALLVDEPAAAGETLDALIGEILAEAASAADVVTAGLAYSVLVDEPATAADLLSATTGIVDAAMDEPTTASDTPDATVITALVSRSAMLPDVFINSDGTSREANAKGVMVNL